MATHEQRIFRLSLLGGLPAVVVSIWLLYSHGYPARAVWTVGVAIVGVWLLVANAVREQVMRPVQMLSNMIAALREQDYSLRARDARSDDALGIAFLEVNALTAEMHDRRLGALEATALLRRVMTEIDVAVFAFDEDDVLRVVNNAGAQLLGQPEEQLLGRGAAELQLQEVLTGNPRRFVELPLGVQRGRWELRRGEFRQGGRPHRFVVLADVSRALREQERDAWQRIIRVLGHEINNSMTPIRSLTDRLRELVKRDWPADELREQLDRGLGVVSSRSESLARFLSSYAQLARLPAPRMRPVNVSEWVQRVARLETRVPVKVDGGPDLTISADGDQLDQLLINLVKNAAEASLPTNGGVRVGWAILGDELDVTVEDDGPGLSDTANLFVPFFTTKPGGTGIGLALSRQIAEGHGGALTLANRVIGGGCIARLVIPLTR